MPTKALNIFLAISVGCCLTSCMTDKEFRQRHQDPSLITEELERNQIFETAGDIEKENIKDEAARQKYLNVIIDKQLHKQADELDSH